MEQGSVLAPRELRVGGPLHRQAVRLRHEVFFRPHGLGEEVVIDDEESSSRHFCLAEENCLVAYVRFTVSGPGARVSQMVVDPAFQGRGYGRALLRWVIGICRGEGVERIELESRLTAVKFYEGLGFHCTGDPYPSRRTGVGHVHMEMRLSFGPCRCI